MRTALYVRVSTQEQAKEGYSLPAQRRKLLAYCEAKEWKVVEIYADEGISGSTIEKRPSATQMLEDAKKHLFDQILIVKIDRLCRNTKDLLTIVDLLNSLDIGLVALEESLDLKSPSGKMMLTMLGSFAEFERATITNRFMSGKIQKALNGKMSNHHVKPYGYDFIDGVFTPNENAPVVKQIFELCKSGYSYTQIKEYLDSHGIKASMGNKWYIEVIGRMLHNPTYIGMVHYNVKNNDPILLKANNVIPIVDEDTFNQVQNILKAKVGVKKQPSEEFIFHGILKCNKCGWRGGCVSTTTPLGKPYKYYRCSGSCSGLCSNTQNISLPNCEKQFLTYMQDFFFELNTKPKEVKERPDYSKQINDLANKKKRLVDLYLQELVDFTDYEERLKDINAKIEYYKSLTPPEEKIIDYGSIQATFTELWDLMDNKEKHLFLVNTFEGIYFENKQIVRVVFK